VLNLLGDIRRETGIGLVFISHDLAVVRYVCEETLVMYRGCVVERGDSRELLGMPTHPYTRLLLSAVPRPGWDPAAIAVLRRTL
jgi:ABC-type oligopeptide transport system ATPase subunit